MKINKKPLKIWLLLSTIGTGSCAFQNKTHPVVSVCVVSNASNGLVCSDKEGKTSFLKMPEAENFMCLSPKDAEILLTR